MAQVLSPERVQVETAPLWDPISHYHYEFYTRMGGYTYLQLPVYMSIYIRTCIVDTCG